MHGLYGLLYLPLKTGRVRLGIGLLRRTTYLTLVPTHIYEKHTKTSVGTDRWGLAFLPGRRSDPLYHDTTFAHTLCYMLDGRIGKVFRDYTFVDIR